MSDTDGSKSYQKKSHKRSYTKSTNGCKACKVRKVKCDEVRPVCSNCRRRFINIDSCDYPPLPKIPGAFEASGSETSQYGDLSILSKPTSFIPIEVSPSNMLALRLLNHYTKTTHGMPSSRQMMPLIIRTNWDVDIPQIAFSSSLVLYAMLGLSALNLSSLIPDDRTLALAANSYLSKALEKHQEALSRLDPSNAEPVLVAAVLIAHHTFLAMHTNEPYKIELQNYHMRQGVKIVAQRVAPWLKQYQWPSEVPKDYRGMAIKHANFLRSALSDADQLLKSLGDHVDAEDRRTYEKASMDVIQNCYMIASGAVEDFVIEQELMSTLHRIHLRVEHFMEDHCPIALAILARQLSLLTLVSDQSAWWIHGAGDFRVSLRGVQGISLLIPSDWRWIMDWPWKIISQGREILS